MGIFTASSTPPSLLVLPLSLRTSQDCPPPRQISNLKPSWKLHPPIATSHSLLLSLFALPRAVACSAAPCPHLLSAPLSPAPHGLIPPLELPAVSVADSRGNWSCWISLQHVGPLPFPLESLSFLLWLLGLSSTCPILTVLFLQNKQTPQNIQICWNLSARSPALEDLASPLISSSSTYIQPCVGSRRSCL